MTLKIRNHPKRQHFVWLIPILLIALSLACARPGADQEVAQETPVASSVVAADSPTEAAAAAPLLPSQPTPTPQPLPPALVEVDPLPGAEFPLQGLLTLYFNQPMDKVSVEAAISGQPTLSGRFNWLDDATLTFQTDAPFLPDTDLSITLNTNAQAANGQFLQEPVNLNYRTASPMKVLQVLPEPNVIDADPTSAILAAFDQPVVPLGADPATMPSAFSIEPSAQGNGEWINTSTYIFYPDPPLAGGQTYTVRFSPGLQSAAGGSFLGRVALDGQFEWTFRTAPPRLISFDPPDGADSVRLDSAFKLNFSQPMDTASVAENFSMYDTLSQPVSGEMAWDEDATTLVFTPTQLLARGTTYNLILLSTAKTHGATPLGVDYVATLQTAPELHISSTTPLDGSVKRPQSSLTVRFNGPVDLDDPLQYITFTPEVPGLTHWWDETERSLSINGDFTPLSAYTVTVSADLPDPWGGTLGEDYTFAFRTGALDPNLFIAAGGNTLFLTPQDTAIQAQATNLDRIGLKLGSVPFDDLFTLLGPGSYEVFQNYQPESLQNWTYEAGLPGDRSYTFQLPLTPAEEAILSPGLYYLSFITPELPFQLPPYLLVSSNVQLSFKLSPDSAFIWAVDLRTNTPVANQTISVYDADGNLLAGGSTNQEGIFQSSIPAQDDLYSTFYAVLGEPGDDLFSLALSNWSQGIEGYEFGFVTDFEAPGITTYLYTDRPIYRPGQTVHFKAVARYEQNGRYSLPDLESLPVTILDNNYAQAFSLDLPLSEFGTAQGDYALPEDAQPGNYQISTPYGLVAFQVAEYRKPEIDLQVEARDSAKAGDSITAQVNARYYFDAPAGNAHLTWNVYKYPTYFDLPGYQVGAEDFRWMGPNLPDYAAIFGELVTSGEADTDSEGLLTIEFATDPQEGVPYRYTLEATLTDESGFPISGRAETLVHPGDFYAGIRPDTWVGQAGMAIGFEILAVDWEKKSAGEQEMKARYQKITWVRDDAPDPFNFPTFTAQYTPVSSASFRTAPNGIARLAFTPPEAGTYVLEVSHADGTRSQALVWVGGTGQAVWPNLPNQQLRLTADKDGYAPGETAAIFIPNPFGAGAQALVTVERDEVLRYEVLTLDDSGLNYTLPLSDADAPNVYVSATLIGQDENGKPDFRQGYLNLPVEPLAETLNVALTAQPEKAGPGEDVAFSVRITDAEGTPVQGEFSLAVVDLAALALADPNAQDILPALYGIQPLGVRYGMSLAVYAQRFANVAGGLGGGGEDEAFIIREDFPDTAYWNAQIVTDANGEAEISLKLPDSLTTWEIDLRGLTADTLVGQARQAVVVTKDLLVRPVTPRFAVAGDHLQLAAVVHNNTQDDLQIDVSLQAVGFILDDPTTENQTISVPAGGRTRVDWWGTVEDVETLDLVFAASANGLQDATRPTVGEIPVLRFLAPQTFGTAGVLDLEGERLEIVSLPFSFDPSTGPGQTGGTLQVELSPSLAAAMTAGFDALEHYPYECTEQTVSRFLPNLMTYRAIQELGLDSPDLQSRLERTLDEGVAELTRRQNEDGGWGWWPTLTPDPPLFGRGELISDDYITAYVVFGLSQARQAGVFVDEAVIQDGVNFLVATRPSLEMLSSTWQLDRLAFHYYAIAQAGQGSAAPARNLYEIRDNLTPYARAFLALTLAAYDPTDERMDTLLSDLGSTAIRSATGVHWEGADYQVNLETSAFNTAVVVYTIAQQDPASFILPEAVRYLMSARAADGAWGSTYETAWSLLALTEVMKGTGELAGDFGFSASLNGSLLLDGQAGGDARLNPVAATIPLSQLYPQDPNALSIERTSGPGRLYYSAHLNVLRPAEDVAPLNRGIGVERFYESADSGQPLAVSNLVKVRIALTLENDAYYLVVEDYIPAGAEILDTSLKTSQQGAESVDLRSPFADGWGWWYFADPQIYDDRIAWATDHIPAGTYELTYTLVLNQPGEFQVLPARAWEFYFPEVQGNSAGDLFVIEE